MTETYFYDCPIKSDKIKDYAVSSKYSEIRIGNNTIMEKIEGLIQPQEFVVINDLSMILEGSLTDEILIFCTSVFSKDLSKLAKFLKFTNFSVINSFWGHKECFIYKGQRTPLIAYLKHNEKNNIYFVNFPEFILDLSSLPQLKSLMSNNHDSRHFNEIKSIGELYVKTSSNAKKLKTEYEFLKNVPDHLRNYYVEVFEFKQEVDLAQYSMVSYDYKDVSHLFLSNGLNEASFKILMSLIETYINDSKKKLDFPYIKNSFEDLIQKNSSRLEELKKISYYDSLNAFLINFKGISIEEHHARIQKKLKENQETFNKEHYIFSHGDLCFSNILFSPEDLEIKLIDPKGFENNGMRSPYYDIAKLSHSILGYYDLIINNMVKIAFDKEMHAYLDFSTLNGLNNFDDLFKKLVSKLKLDMTLIRLIEASLFLSMIPFHYENKRKAFMLCLRSVEIFEDL